MYKLLCVLQQITVLQVISLTNAKPSWHLQNFQYSHFNEQSIYFYDSNVNVSDFPIQYDSENFIAYDGQSYFILSGFTLNKIMQK